MHKQPKQGELVLATIQKIFKYGAFCTLDEYDNMEAFLHISEVAPRWIKNIHEFLKEKQKVVALVYRFIPEKNQIDISLKRVREAERKAKIGEHRREKRGMKLFELAAKKMKKDFNKALEEAGAPLTTNFGDIYTAFEELSFNTENALQKVKLSKEWKNVLVEIAKQNIRKAVVKINRIFSITSYSPNGIDIIKEALLNIKKKETKDININISYRGAPMYMVSVSADNYKIAEKALNKIEEELINYIKDGEVKSVGE